MRATSYESDQKIGNLVEEAQVGGGDVHVAKSIYNRSSSTVDVEKGEVYQAEAPALLENMISCEVDAHEHESHSKRLIVSEKIIVTLLVVCFVVVEAYFVGVSFRDWLDQQKPGNSTTVLLANQDGELFVPEYLQVYKTGECGGGQDVITEDSEPLEDFEGGLSLEGMRVFLGEMRHQQEVRETESTERKAREKAAVDLEDTAIRDSPSFGT